jgi:hypothetical protein
MFARTIASYSEKNMNSKISVQGAMLVSTNRTTTLRMGSLPTVGHVAHVQLLLVPTIAMGSLTSVDRCCYYQH